jgi:hypothetical protein
MVCGIMAIVYQVFRCASAGKGWGVRCVDSIPAGTYVTDYIGEVRHIHVHMTATIQILS